MKTMSVNGKLVPTDNQEVKDEYTGHFLKVSYTQEIAKHPVFSKDRVDVEGDGLFRFYMPKKELLINEMITLEVFSPDGEMLGNQVYSYGSLKAVDISVNAEDNSQLLEIDINPKVIKFNSSAPSEESHKKISGKVIDLSGEKKPSGLQIIIMVSDNPDSDFDSSSYKPVFSAMTDKNGYFYGRVANKNIQKAFGVITGNEDQPILIPLEDKKIPNNILLVSDLSNLPEEFDCSSNGDVPVLPDNDDLINSSAFSQDIGGKCVDFTVPNRTLEEFSFYHTVRTTEPEIKGLTITSKESKKIKDELFDISNNIFIIFGRLNNSFNSLSLLPFSIEEDKKTETSVTESVKVLSSATGGTHQVRRNFPNYVLKMDIGDKQRFNINSNDLLTINKGFVYTDIIKIAKEQTRRRKKLIELHQKLAAAYCGKNGIEEAKTFCEKLSSQDSLNREEIKSLVGHIEKNKDSINMNEITRKQFTSTLFEIEKLTSKQLIEGILIKEVGEKIEKLIQTIDKNTEESQEQENMLGYMRRIVIELASASESSGLNFEPCPPSGKSETMGILCLIQRFKEIKNTLRNTSIFSLGEILEIRSYYTVFLESISSFMTLLDEFYSFYSTGTNFSTELVDDYFYTQYDEIKSTLTSLKRQIYWAINKVEEIERAYILNHPGRVNLSVENSIDWDETPTIYENTTIANGHILHFKQIWKSAGFSLGDCLYSLPLAPCQEKQIAIIDWDRKEQGSRTEAQIAADELQADISRDRDITEIMNSSFGESITASSTNNTSSTSAGIGGGIGGFIGKAVFGVAGGISHSGASSKSTATQNSSRNISANTLNRLQDSTSQSASSLRSQRSTVVQTVAQNESVSVQTEVIKNNNHCHAMTIEYFEVLRHYAIEQQLVDVQECLFVPMPMSHFNHKKVLRWKNTLQRIVYGRKLRRGFNAIERIESDYVNSDLPIGSYANEVIEEFSGHFTISFELTRPFIKSIDEATKTEEYDLSIPFPWFFGRMVFHLEREVPLTEAEKDAVFEEQYVPDIVRSFIDRLQVDAISDDGREEKLELDVTLLSNYTKGAALKVSIASKAKQNITRAQIKHLRFRASTDVKASSKIILRSAYLHYRTKHLSEYIVRNSRVNNDIMNSSILGGLITVTDAALMYTPLNNRELRNPHKEDQDAASALVSFLNENMEMSHKIIWSNMDASRLFGLLDGFIAPYSGGKSVASVVENKIMGIVGNNLVLKVIPGERLDPVFKGVENLLEYYKPTTKPDPFRVSVPTKGVYAESVMGKCNSCEEIDETRHWRFNDEPCGTKPTAIDPISTASRRSDPGNLQVKDLPTNIINMQTAPSAPDPTGLAAAYGLLGKGDAFKDLTGLTGTQANALSALQTTSKSVTDLASISKDFAGLAVMANQKKDGAKQIEQIKKLNKDGYLNDEEANEQIKKVLDSYTDAAKSVTKSPDNSENSVASKIAQKAVENGLSSENKEIEYTKVNSEGNAESIKVTATSYDESNKNTAIEPIFYNVALIPQPNKTSCWAAAMAMLESYRLSEEQQASIVYSANELADDFGYSLEQSYEWDRLNDVKEGLGLEIIKISGKTHPSPKQWQEMLSKHGPLYVTIEGIPSHAIIVNGISGDSTLSGTEIDFLNPINTKITFDNNDTVFNPPNNGLKSTLSVEDLNRAFNGGELSELKFYENWRILYHPDLGSEVTSIPTTGQSIACENLPTLIELRTEAIDVAREEALHWTNNSLVESSTNALPRLEEYYLATIDRTARDIRRSDRDARRVANNRARDASRNTQPWSATFISWCYVKAYSNLNPGVVGFSLRDYARCLRDNDLFNADRGHFRYVRDALDFPGPVYEQVNHATTQVEVGDWIYATRNGGTHVDIVLELFETQDRSDNPIKWALSAGGNISHTAGFRIYSLDVNGRLTTNHASPDRPDNTSLATEIGLNLSQINSWRGAPGRMRGLVRLV